MERRPLTIVDAPTNLGLKPPSPGREPGTRHAPDTLRHLGLHDALQPQNVIRVEAAAYAPDEAHAVTIRNIDLITEHAVRLADAVETAIRGGHFALVLGGDCSVLIGSALGLRRIGEMGLLFVDGHTDSYLPHQSSTGGAAGLDLALATGWGPKSLTNIEGLGPYFSVARVASFGNRDEEHRADSEMRLLPWQASITGRLMHCEMKVLSPQREPPWPPSDIGTGFISMLTPSIRN